ATPALAAGRARSLPAGRAWCDEHLVHLAPAPPRAALGNNVGVSDVTRAPAGEQGRAPASGPAAPPAATPAQRATELPDDRYLNRKSTRLNSSHVKISYAVFCLKKKKKKNE